MEWLPILIIIPITMAFSYAHGRGDDLDGKPEKRWFETKGLFIAGETLAAAAIGFACIGWLGMFAAIVSPLYWFLFRTGKQARAELDYMGRVRDKIIKIIQQYYLPIGVCCALIVLFSVISGMLWYSLLSLLCIASVAAVYFTAKEFRNDAGEKAGDNRWPVETFGNGFCGGVNIACVMFSGFEVLRYAG